jgi:hypothetical protein
VIESITRAESSLPTGAVHSIGVLSSFRGQADHLLACISRHPRAEAFLSRHDLLAGTAHTFQGEEHDLMFVSLALDDQSASTSYRFLEKADVFSVSITRGPAAQPGFPLIRSRPPGPSFHARPILRQRRAVLQSVRDLAFCSLL